MANSLFQAYKLKITTFSPVHIGDMLDFEPTNYVIYNAEDTAIQQPPPLREEFVVCPECGYKNKVADLLKNPYCLECDEELKLPDSKPNVSAAELKIGGTAYLYTFTPKQLAEVLSDADKKELLDIARKGNYISLEEFFKKRTAKIVPYASMHAEVCSEVYKNYRKKFGNAEEQYGQRNQFVIEKNISNPATDAAYIPGSSLKGAIRTALMNMANKKRRLCLDDIKETSDKGVKYSASVAENLLYGYKKQTQDPFKYLKISDTVPLAAYITKICKAQNHGKISPVSDIYSYTEIIPQHTDFSSELAIDTRFSEDINSVCQACNSFYGSLLENEQRYMCNTHKVRTEFFNEIKQKLQEPNTFLLRLGKHCGAESVTIDGLRRIKVNHGKGKDGKFISEILDHATTYWLAENGEEKLPFGWCVAEYEEVK